MLDNGDLSLGQNTQHKNHLLDIRDDMSTQSVAHIYDRDFPFVLSAENTEKDDGRCGVIKTSYDVVNYL